MSDRELARLRRLEAAVRDDALVREHRCAPTMGMCHCAAQRLGAACYRAALMKLLDMEGD